MPIVVGPSVASDLLSQQPTLRSSLLNHVFFRSISNLIDDATRRLATMISKAVDTENLSASSLSSNIESSTSINIDSESATVTRLQSLLTQALHLPSISHRGPILYGIYALNLALHLDRTKAHHHHLVEAQDKDELTSQEYWRAHYNALAARVSRGLETVTPTTHRMFLQREVRASVWNLYCDLCRQNTTGRELGDILDCAGMKAFVASLNNLEAETWDDVVARAPDEESEAESPSKGARIYEFVRRLLWKVSASYSAVASNGLPSMSTGTGDETNPATSPQPFVGGGCAVADGLRVALAAESAEQLLHEPTNEPPCQWRKVTSSGIMSLRELRKAGVSALSGLFGWGRQKTSKKVSTLLNTVCRGGDSTSLIRLFLLLLLLSLLLLCWCA